MGSTETLSKVWRSKARRTHGVREMKKLRCKVQTMTSMKLTFVRPCKIHDIFFTSTCGQSQGTPKHKTWSRWVGNHHHQPPSPLYLWYHPKAREAYWKSTGTGTSYNTGTTRALSEFLLRKKQIQSPLKGDMGPNKYPLFLRCIWGLIIKGTIPRVPAFSLWNRNSLLREP